MTVLISILLTALCVVQGASYKLLFLPAPVGSHLIQQCHLAAALIQAGHEAHLVKHHSIPVPAQFHDSGIVFIPHGEPDQLCVTLTPEYMEFNGNLYNKNFWQMLKFGYSTTRRIARRYLDDERMLQRLQSERYDLAIIDNMFTTRSLYAIAYRLGVPWGSFGIFPPMHMMSQIHYTDLPIAVVDSLYYSEEPSFFLRFCQFIFIQFVKNGVVFDSDYVTEFLKRNSTPYDGDVIRLKELSKLWLVDRMNFGTPRQAASNVIYVGGITAGPPKALPTDLQKFADSAEDGLVVVNFGGSTTTSFPEEQLRRLLLGLSAIKQKVVIRLKSKPAYLGSNVMVTQWLPQNDLLGHPNSVLFITHCGLASINEAVYHGVPMLAMAGHREQIGNAYVMVRNNYGQQINRGNFTSNDIVKAVETILQNTKIKTSIKKVSSIIRDGPRSPKEEAVYWIEHVIKFGGDHLEAYTSKLAWYEILMFDIALACVAIVALLVYILLKCARCVRRLCCQRKVKIKTS